MPNPAKNFTTQQQQYAPLLQGLQEPRHGGVYQLLLKKRPLL